MRILRFVALCAVFASFGFGLSAAHISTSGINSSSVSAQEECLPLDANPRTFNETNGETGFVMPPEVDGNVDCDEMVVFFRTLVFDDTDVEVEGIFPLGNIAFEVDGGVFSITVSDGQGYFVKCDQLPDESGSRGNCVKEGFSQSDQGSTFDMDIGDSIFAQATNSSPLEPMTIKLSFVAGAESDSGAMGGRMLAIAGKASGKMGGSTTRSGSKTSLACDSGACR